MASDVAASKAQQYWNMGINIVTRVDGILTQEEGAPGRFLENITDAPTQLPTVSPTLSPSEEDDGLILVLGVIGFILFFGVVGFFAVNFYMTNKETFTDTTGGRPLAGNQTVPLVRATSPLQSTDAGDRGSMSTIFSTDSHMSMNSGYYNGKIEAEEGKDSNLMNLLKGKRAEHNKRKGKKERQKPQSNDLGLSAANSMQEMEAV